MVVGLYKTFLVLEDLDRDKVQPMDFHQTGTGTFQPPRPPQAQGVDPVLAGLMQQQLQLGQTLIDVMRRQQPQQPQQPPVGVPERERHNGHKVDPSNATTFVQAVG